MDEPLFNGPGKYDDLTTYVREQTGALGVALIVYDGNKGAGFGVQGTLPFIATLPETLEEMAKRMRDQMAGA